MRLAQPVCEGRRRRARSRNDTEQRWAGPGGWRAGCWGGSPGGRVLNHRGQWWGPNRSHDRPPGGAVCGPHSLLAVAAGQAIVIGRCVTRSVQRPEFRPTGFLKNSKVFNDRPATVERLT
jgi:hypothetical protein